MGMGGKGSSESKQTVTNDNDLFNQQVGASEGGVAFGAGSGGGNIINDASVITRAGDAIRDVAGVALVQGGKNVDSALSFGRDSLGVVERTVAQANDILARSGETYAARMAGQSTPTETNAMKDVQKTVIYAGAAIAGIFLLKGVFKKG